MAVYSFGNPSGSRIGAKLAVALLVLLAMSGCITVESNADKNSPAVSRSSRMNIPSAGENEDVSDKHTERNEKSLFNPKGMSLEQRIMPPEGYTRSDTSGFGRFIREYALKEDGAAVLLYDKREKANQNAHAAVFAMPLGERDLQQCADSIMRLYAEYLYTSQQADKIGFHFVNGFYADYGTWRSGKRIKVSKDSVYWVSSKAYDDSAEAFESYLNIVFAYASTLSMEGESKAIALENAQIGDIFLKAGSPGHVVMIADIAENADRKRAYLLAQGYMPAQEFHLLNNPAHTDDPWYYEDEMLYPLQTPEYRFEEGSLRHPVYLD